VARPASPRLVEKCSINSTTTEENQNDHRPGRRWRAGSCPCYSSLRNSATSRRRAGSWATAANTSTRSAATSRSTAPRGCLTGCREPGDRNPNRVAPPIEKAILAHALRHPTHGAQRVADELMLRGLQVSSGGVRGVWIRNNLKTRHERLLRLEQTVRKRKIKLTEEQILALERFNPEFRERHIEVHATGELVAVDTFFAGTLKGVGKVYIQTVLDCFSRYVRARLYTSKMPVTAVQILNHHVLPFFEEHAVKIRTILSDNGREYCGRPDKHPYELFLQLEDIEHRTTKVGRPQSNGFIERFHRTVLEEHLRIKGRTTWYETVEEMQKDLDVYLEELIGNGAHRDDARV